MLTNSIAVMKAAAKAVAVSRLAEKVAIIVWSLFFCPGPLLSHGTFNAGTVPISFSLMKSVPAVEMLQNNKP